MLPALIVHCLIYLTAFIASRIWSFLQRRNSEGREFASKGRYGETEEVYICVAGNSKH